MLKKQIVIVSVVLVLLFLPVIVYSQTAILFTVKGTVKNPDGSNAGNGLAVEVKNVTAEEEIGTLVSRNTITGIAKIAKDDTEDDMDPAYSVTFTPYKGNIAAAVGDIIEVRVYNNQGGLFDKEVSYTLTQEDIDKGWAEVDVPPPCHTFTICLAKGQNVISIPVDTTSEMCEPKIERVSDFAEELLGNDWSLIMTLDAETQEFLSFTPQTSPDAPSNVNLTCGTGLIVVMKAARIIEITGKGCTKSNIQLKKGMNLIGVPLKDPSLERVKDLINKSDGCVSTITIYDTKSEESTGPKEYLTVTSVTGKDAPSNKVIDGDTGLIIVATRDCSIPITGESWNNGNRRKPCP